MNNNTTCVIPWLHLNIIPKGKVYHCCMTSDYKTYAGDLTKQSLEEVWNGEYMMNLRKDMINGIEPKACSKCFEAERSSGTSTRHNHNKFYKSKLDEIPVITEPSGRVDKIELKYWDFRFSNLCNYKCRTCGPDFSSSWIPDSKEMGWMSEEEVKKTFNIATVDDKANLDFLKDQVQHVEKIYFAGGEPLLMDEHWQILEMLDQAKRYEVILTYNSNLSKLTYKNQNALEYWKKWGRRVWLWPSIDEIDERAELIRSGTNWPQVEENLRACAAINIHIRPSITVSAMNVHRIPEIITRLVDLGVIKQEYENMKNIAINVVEYSARFHVSILSDARRAEIKKNLDEFITNYEQKYNTDIRQLFLHLFWHLDKPHNPAMAAEFRDFTKRIDAIRGEDTLSVIPELKDVLG